MAFNKFINTLGYLGNALVVDVLAESQGRHFDVSLGADQAVARGQVFVNKALIGQVLHPPGNLETDSHLGEQERRIMKRGTVNWVRLGAG